MCNFAIRVILGVLLLVMCGACGNGASKGVGQQQATTTASTLDMVTSEGLSVDMSGVTDYGSPTTGGGAAQSTASYAVSWLPQVPPGDWAHTLNCGPASLAMLEAYYKSVTPSSTRITELMQQLENVDPSYRPSDGNGTITSSWQLVALAKRISFTEARSVKFSTLADLKDAISSSGPCIVSFRTGRSVSGVKHWVVCTGFESNQLYINDPGRSNSAPTEERIKVPVANATFWDVFKSAGSVAVFLKNPPNTSVVWADYKTIYRFIDSYGGRHYSESTTPAAGINYEREAFVIRTTQINADQLGLYNCDHLSDGILAIKTIDVTSLTSAGFSCKQIGYTAGSTEAPFPFPFVCAVKRYSYKTPSGLGAHLFTTGPDSLVGMTLESSAYFYAFSNFACQ